MKIYFFLGRDAESRVLGFLLQKIVYTHCPNIILIVYMYTLSQHYSDCIYTLSQHYSECPHKITSLSRLEQIQCYTYVTMSAFWAWHCMYTLGTVTMFPMARQSVCCFICSCGRLGFYAEIEIFLEQCIFYYLVPYTLCTLYSTFPIIKGTVSHSA